MAVRIEFFTVEGADDFERVPAATLDAAVARFDADESAGASDTVRCVGWLSASDDDEERFTDWCDEVDDDLGIGLLQQGAGEAAGLVPPAQDATALASDGEWATAWSGVLRAALEAAAGGRFAWRTDFDLPGSAAPGDDYPTASHRAGAGGSR